ncbi:hypothetical protein [Brachybacterium subflavum]|uniref:hypothetical protein n=1 Tax=Brachybacterium subflavum TaxID=2585206 RepID=UPI0012663707|nr:hypothetical protein [Brachybacterium subflavum]
MPTDLSTRTISRSTLLRSGLALAGGALGATVLGSGPLGTPDAAAVASGAGASTAPAKTSSAVRLPASWKGTVFTQPLPAKSDGYIASHTVLHGEGAITSLSAKRIAQADGISNFLPYGEYEQIERFTPHVAGAARLDGGPVRIRFVGNKGRRITAEVHLVRTADPKSPGLLLHVLGKSASSIALPPRTAVVWDAPALSSPSKLKTAGVRELLEQGVGFSFGEEGPNPAHSTRASVLDGGRHVVGEVSVSSHGSRTAHRWYGTAVRADGGWSYLVAELPEKS